MKREAKKVKYYGGGNSALNNGKVVMLTYEEIKNEIKESNKYKEIYEEKKINFDEDKKYDNN